MKKLKITSLIALIKGILMILLGIVHNIALFIFKKEDKTLAQIPEYIKQELFLWFAVGGIFFIFIGIIDLISCEGIKKGMRWAWKTSFISAAVCCLSASIGIVVYKEGPPFLILALGLLEIIPLLLYKKNFDIWT